MRKDGTDKAGRAFIQAFNSLFSPDPEKLTAEDIRNLNNSALPVSSKRNIMSTRHDVSSTTFVIPVSDGGTITAYYLVSRKQHDEKGLMPLTIYCHGGGIFHANMDFYSTWLRYVAYTLETAILLVDYRLAPLHKFPTAVEDCYDAVLWACEGAKYWKADPDSIYLAGDGFGASLAATTAILLRDRKGPKISGEVLLYPMTDGRLRTGSMEECKETPVLSQKTVGWYIKNYSREQKDSLSPMMSPLLSQDLSRLPDTLIIGAEIDPLRDDSTLYAEALREAGTAAKALIVPGAMHGFIPFRSAPGRKEAERAIWLFMAGRNVDNVTLMDKKEFKAFRKTHTL